MTLAPIIMTANVFHIPVVSQQLEEQISRLSLDIGGSTVQEIVYRENCRIK